MNLSLRTLNDEEVESFKYDGRLVISLVVPNSPELDILNRFAVLEYQCGEGSAEGPSWAPVEIC